MLDPFAGSGALAIEAISRGASRAVAIEPDSNAFKVVNQNIKDLGLEDKIKATKAYFKAWSARNLGQSFDLILADPPYDHPPLEDIETLSKHLNQTGILVLSWPGQQTALQLKNLKQVQAKSYGDAQLVFYKKIS